MSDSPKADFEASRKIAHVSVVESYVWQLTQNQAHAALIKLISTVGPQLVQDALDIALDRD